MFHIPNACYLFHPSFSIWSSLIFVEEYTLWRSSLCSFFTSCYFVSLSSNYSSEHSVYDMFIEEGKRAPSIMSSYAMGQLFRTKYYTFPVSTYNISSLLKKLGVLFSVDNLLTWWFLELTFVHCLCDWSSWGVHTAEPHELITDFSLCTGGLDGILGLGVFPVLP
jgi:hypothetical protein